MKIVSILLLCGTAASSQIIDPTPQPHHRIDCYLGRLNGRYTLNYDADLGKIRVENWGETNTIPSELALPPQDVATAWWNSQQTPEVMPFGVTFGGPARFIRPIDGPQLTTGVNSWRQCVTTNGVEYWVLVAESPEVDEATILARREAKELALAQYDADLTAVRAELASMLANLASAQSAFTNALANAQTNAAFTAAQRTLLRTLFLPVLDVAQAVRDGGLATAELGRLVQEKR